MKLHRGLLCIGFRELKGPISLVAVIGLAIVACWVGQALLIAYSLAAVLRGGGLDQLVVPVIALLGTVAVRAVLLWLRDVAAQWAGLIIKERLRRTLFTALLDLGPAYTTARRTGASQSILVDGVEGLQGYYAYYLPQVVVVISGAGGILIYLATIDPTVAIVLAAFTVFVPIAPKLWNRRLAKRGDSHWESYQEVEADYVDGIQGMTTLKALTAVESYRDQLERRTWRLYRRTMRQLAVSLVGTSLTTLLMGVGTATVVMIATVQLTANQLTPVQLLTVLLLSAECFRPLRDLANYWHLSYLGFSAGNEVTKLLTTPGPAVRPPTIPPATTTSAAAIRFREVSFTYPDQERPAVASVDLRIAPGETVAFVGPSGAGKTTVLNLLLRFLEPQHGAIEIDGRDVRAIPLHDLRELVSLVPQDPYLFHGTIEDNIRLGSSLTTREQVRDAARIADIDGFIESLELGYRSPIGERGLTLSGGQRQRITIARAVLRESPILLLDEATAHLDGESEAAIGRTLDRLAGRTTTLIVAHRLSTVRRADRVLVLSDGELVESGEHDELLAQRGAYHRMVRLEQDHRRGGAA